MSSHRTAEWLYWHEEEERGGGGEKVEMKLFIWFLACLTKPSAFNLMWPVFFFPLYLCTVSILPHFTLPQINWRHLQPLGHFNTSGRIRRSQEESLCNGAYDPL